MRKSTVRRSRGKNVTRKNMRGGLFGDNKLVTISYKDKVINCAICGQDKFQERNGTIDKSKTSRALFTVFVGENPSLSDMSVYMYYCNECGNSIIIRDPKSKEEGTYMNLVKSTPVS